MEFPTLDLSPLVGGRAEDVAALARHLDAACSTIGFLAITNHGVPPTVIDGAWSAATQFFDLPLEEKQLLHSDDPEYPFGYVGMEAEALGAADGSAANVDLKETFNLAPPARPEVEQMGGHRLRGPEWPTKPVGFKDAWSAYYAEMEDLAARLMRLFALALSLPAGFFEDKIDRHMSALRAVNYPSQPVAPIAGQIRAGAHSDYGTLTILLPGQGTGGLEVTTRDGSWLPVPRIPDTFVVNLGDLMAIWTNDRWRSTIHRVVNPDAAVAASERRQSMAFFHQPNWDAEVSCLPTCTGADNPPKYPPTRSGPWLRQKVNASRGLVGE